MLSCFKQKTAYEVRIRDWSSDVCYSDLPCLCQCPAATDPYPEPCASDAAVLGLGRGGTQRSSRRNAAALCRDVGFHTVPAVHPCRSWRPTPHCRADRRGPIGRVGTARLAVPPLSGSDGPSLLPGTACPRGRSGDGGQASTDGA